jgi:hypothetical protein
VWSAGTSGAERIFTASHLTIAVSPTDSLGGAASSQGGYV